MITTSDFKRGRKIEYKGDPCEIIEFQHSKTARGGALVKTKLKNLLTGSIIDETFRSGEKFPPPQLEEKEMQYLYEQEGTLNFMDNVSYEQIEVPASQLGESRKLLKENTVITALLYKGAPIAINLPIFVELEVAETDPGFKGDTASGGGKPATVETGAVIKVPFHIDQGDIIKIDTRSWEYIERVK